MLAIVGFLLTQYVHLPGDQFQAGPLEAITTVPLGAQAQVFTCKWAYCRYSKSFLRNHLAYAYEWIALFHENK